MSAALEIYLETRRKELVSRVTASTFAEGQSEWTNEWFKMADE